MHRLIPSGSFKKFEEEAGGFEIQAHPKGGELRFEAKQRMITRAEGIAIREAYAAPWWRLLVPGVFSFFFEGLKRCDEGLAKADPTFKSDPDADDRRHRAEICLNLYARTIQQFTLRRLYTAAILVAAWAAVASTLAVVLTAETLTSPKPHDTRLAADTASQSAAPAKSDPPIQVTVHEWRLLCLPGDIPPGQPPTQIELTYLRGCLDAMVAKSQNEEAERETKHLIDNLPSDPAANQWALEAARNHEMATLAEVIKTNHKRQIALKAYMAEIGEPQTTPESKP